MHWLLTPVRKLRDTETTDNDEALPCPIHSDLRGISAPDLLFMDVRTEMRVTGSRVTLERFLGRGAFGSVFAGSAFFSANNCATSTTDDSLLNLVKVNNLY